MKSKFIFGNFFIMNFAAIVFLGFVMINCNSSKVGYPSDFSVSYQTKNALMNYELNIDLQGNELSLKYNNSQMNKSGKGNYTVKDSESKEIYNYLKSVNFTGMKQPPPDQILDAPEQTIKASYDDRSNTINFGSVKEPPVELLTIKKKLMDLAAKYDKTLSSDMGW